MKVRVRVRKRSERALMYNEGTVQRVIPRAADSHGKSSYLTTFGRYDRVLVLAVSKVFSECVFADLGDSQLSE